MRIKREPRHFFKACKMIWNIISTEITCTNTFRSGLSERGVGLTVTPGRLILNWLNSPAYQTENVHPNSMFSPTSVCLQRGAKPVRRDREWAFKYAGPADAPKAGQRVFYYYNTLPLHTGFPECASGCSPCVTISTVPFSAFGRARGVLFKWLYQHIIFHVRMMACFQRNIRFASFSFSPSTLVMFDLSRFP